MTTKKYILTEDDVVDNLTSTSQDVPLSANQGRVLNTSKVDINQGTAQAGKVLGIGSDGKVYAMSAGTAAHASTHASGGSDAVSLAASQITSGTLAAARLPKATTSAVGGVKVGSGLSVASDGTLSASGGGGVKTLTLSPNGTYGSDMPLSTYTESVLLALGYGYTCSGTIKLSVTGGKSGSVSYYQVVEISVMSLTGALTVVGTYQAYGTSSETFTISIPSGTNIIRAKVKGYDNQGSQRFQGFVLT